MTDLEIVHDGVFYGHSGLNQISVIFRYHPDPAGFSIHIGVKSAAEICREHRLKPQVFSRWKIEFIDRAPEIFATRPGRGGEQERVAELERMVGRLTMELEAAKKASNILTSLSNGRGR